MADYIERDSSNSVLWAVLGVAALLVVAWLLWSASTGSPAIPNTGSVQVETPAPTQ